MKRLLIILGVFAVMIGFAVWEVVATGKFYRESLSLLNELEDSFAVYEETLDDPENLRALEKVERQWNKGRRLVLGFGNHTTIRNIDERIVSLGTYTRENEYADAMSNLKLAQKFIEELLGDVYPNLTNLL